MGLVDRSPRRRDICCAAPLAALGLLVGTAACSTSEPPVQSVTSLETSTVTVSTTTAVRPPEKGATWRFHLVTTDGWEYDAVAIITAKVQFGKTIETSPPGKAKISVRLTGVAEATFSPTLPGRRAPELPIDKVWASFPEGTTKEIPNLHPTPCNKMVGEQPLPADALVCTVTEPVGTYVTDTDDEESDVDRFVAKVQGAKPSHFNMTLTLREPNRLNAPGVYCLVALLSDGRVASQTIDTCQVSGSNTFQL